MLASITPLGERARQHRWTITAAIYILATALGGAATGAVVALAGLVAAGHLPLGARLGVLGAALAAGAAWELAGRRVPGPQRQVDERWLRRYRRWVYAGGYGVQLGAGIFTVVVSSTVYVIWVASFLSSEPAVGALIGTGAGAMRGASVLGAARVVSPERLVALHRRMTASEGPTRRLALGAQLALGAASVLVAASV